MANIEGLTGAELWDKLQTINETTGYPEDARGNPLTDRVLLDANGNLIDGVGNSATSAIVESGSNSDGEWVRFADGTQICWINEFVCSYESSRILRDTWTFPMAFSSNQIQINNVLLYLLDFSASQRAESILLDNQNQTITATDAMVRVYMEAGLFSSGDEARIGVTAIGKWS